MDFVDFRQLAPFMNFYRQYRGAEELLDQYAGQYRPADSPYSGQLFDNIAINPRRGSPFRTRHNGVQDFHWPAVRTWGLPIDAFQGRAFGGYPLTVPLVDVDPRHPIHSREHERLPDGGRIIDVLDEENPSRFDVGQRRGESSRNRDRLSSVDFNHCDYPEACRWPDAERSTLSPERYSSYQHRHARPQERQLRGMARRMATPRADGDRGRNPQIGAQRDTSLPFRKAMQWLNDGLVQAETFYQKFYNDYDEETKSIRYADADTLQELWVQKVTGKAAARRGGSLDKQPAEKYEETFAEMKRVLHEAIGAALNANLSLGDQEPPKVATLDARKRLLEKVETAGYHVMDLQGLATTKGSEHCKALLAELKMLKELVSPKKNKSLYEGVEGGGVGGGLEDGGAQDGEDYNDNDADPVTW